MFQDFFSLEFCSWQDTSNEEVNITSDRDVRYRLWRDWVMLITKNPRGRSFSLSSRSQFKNKICRKTRFFPAQFNVKSIHYNLIVLSEAWDSSHDIFSTYVSSQRDRLILRYLPPPPKISKLHNTAGQNAIGPHFLMQWNDNCKIRYHIYFTFFKYSFNRNDEALSWT